MGLGEKNIIEAAKAAMERHGDNNTHSGLIKEGYALTHATVGSDPEDHAPSEEPTPVIT